MSYVHTASSPERCFLRERGTRTTQPRALKPLFTPEQPEAPRPLAKLEHPSDMAKSGLEQGFDMAT